MNKYTDAAVTVSIVSHGQGSLVSSLLVDISRCEQIEKVIVTLNIPESEFTVPESLHGRLQIIRNECPFGFGANHNKAFRLCTTKYFVVLNPDIRIGTDPFPELLSVVADNCVGVVAPAVVNHKGDLEDSARYFPTLFRLIRRYIGLRNDCFPLDGVRPLEVDWLAGMFLLFRSEVFENLRGFDERFFLYCEDVDSSVRLWKQSYRVMLCPNVRVIHDAQRASRKRVQYAMWHISSMVRYFAMHAGRLPR